jgi:hypothetical protein
MNCIPCADCLVELRIELERGAGCHTDSLVNQIRAFAAFGIGKEELGVIATRLVEAMRGVGAVSDASVAEIPFKRGGLVRLGVSEVVLRIYACTVKKDPFPGQMSIQPVSAGAATGLVDTRSASTA